MKTNFVATVSDLRNRAWKAALATWPTMLAMSFILWAVNELQYHLMPLLALILSLVTLLLQAGLTRGALTHLRGGEIDVSHIGSMFPYWKQVICFRLWEGLFMLLWMLPGLFLTMVGFGIVEFAGGGAGTTAGWVIAGSGLVLMFVLLFRAALNYLLASCCIIDTPSMGGVAALEKSKQLMRGHRWRYVCMSFPFLLVIIAVLSIQITCSRGMISTAHHALLSLLSIIPQILFAYIVPVLYQELNDRL